MEEKSRTFNHALSISEYDHELAIQLYTNEIENNDEKNIAAWNNRGVCKVNLGLKNKNKEMIESGMSDIETAIAIADTLEVKGYPSAVGNLVWAKKEMEKAKI